MANFNFYTKNTVLNNILKNYSINFSNSYYLLENYSNVNKELYVISNQYEEQYINNLSLVNSEYNNKSLFEILTTNFSNYYTTNIDNLSKTNITNNIKRYNSNNSYINSSKYLDDNSIILNYSNNSYNLYYNTNNTLNLLSYNISFINGFNYDKDNHIIYFDIDNKYIKNIHNILYYNYNNINNKNIYNYGLFSVNKEELSIDKKNNLILNSEFKFNIQSNVKKLKKLYDDCNHIYEKLDFYYNNDNYKNSLNIINSIDSKNNKTIITYNTVNTPQTIYIHSNNVIPVDVNGEIKYKTKFIKSVQSDKYNDVHISSGEFYVDKTDNINENQAYSFSLIETDKTLTTYNITYVSYEFIIKYTYSNLYYSDNNYQLNNLNIKNINTLYTKNINQTSFKIINNIDNINFNNIDNFRNKSFLKNYNKNNIDLNITHNDHIITYTSLKYKNIGSKESMIDIVDQHENPSIDVNPIHYGRKSINEINYGANNYEELAISNTSIKDQISYKVCENSSYTISINSKIDNSIFYNSGITVEYQESPYLTDIDEEPTIIDYGEGNLIYSKDNYELKYINYKKFYQTIYIPLPNILSINYNNNNIYKNHIITKSIFNSYIYRIQSNKKKYYNTSYYILSSVNLFNKKPSNSILIESNNKIYAYNSNDNNIKINNGNISIYKYTLNNYIINYLQSNNLIYDSYTLNYYSSYNYERKKYNYYPILNNYPNKYLNSKFFNIIDNDKIPSEYELNSCISDIKETKEKILYLYELVINSYYSPVLYTYYNNDKELLNYSYLIFNSYGPSKPLNNTVNDIVDKLNNSNIKDTFYNHKSSYIMSTYIKLNNISNSINGKNNLRNYIMTYSNNFIKFI